MSMNSDSFKANLKYHIPNSNNYTARDVDTVLQMSKEEIMRNYTVDQLNELCTVCGICNGSNFTMCKIAAATHAKDPDKVDIFGEAKYNQHMYER